MKTVQVIWKCNKSNWELILGIALVLLICQCGYSQSYISHTNYKYKTAQDVFNDITWAIGNPIIHPPELEIKSKSSSQKYIAAYIPGEDNLIVIDEDLYDLAMTFEADSLDALASIIAHELAHHYKEHGFCSDFAFHLGKKDTLAKWIKKIEFSRKKMVEIEADHFGMFYGHLAGYNTVNTFPQLLDKIYAYYDLPEKIRGYPSRYERKKIAKTQSEKVIDLIAVFDAGELLFSLRKYEEAYLCFAKLAKEFPSRDIFNNIAVIRLYQAIQLVKTEDQPFLLPIEFDAETRLKNGELRDLNTYDYKIKKYVEEAIGMLKKAIRLDPNYLNSKINLGCSYILLKNNRYAIGIVDDQLKDETITINQKDLSRLYTLRGIGYFHDGETRKAKSDLRQAKKNDNKGLTFYNNWLIEKLTKSLFAEFVDQLLPIYINARPTEQPISTPINPLDEKIGNINTDQISLNESRKTITIKNDNQQMTIATSQTQTYSDLIIASNKTHLKNLCTNLGYTGKTAKGLGLYYPESMLYKTYGRPTYIIAALNGKYFKYEKNKIIFYVNSKGKIAKWWIYQFN